jgi:sulfatase modifying factor 1
MKKTRLLLLFCLGTLQAYSQSISNTDFTVNGSQIIVTYDLNATDAKQTFDVSLYISKDNGSIWQGPLTYVMGNVGKAQTAGNNRLIIWDAIREYGTLKGSIGFRVQAKVNNPIMDINLPEMVFVKGGTFQMGSNDGESDQKPVHSVTVSDFYMGKYEVTVAEFEKFINATNYQTDADKGGNSWVYTIHNMGGWKKEDGVNWRYDAKGDKRPRSEYNHPVIHISWNDATAYCKWLKETTGKDFRLPTEAEWEYAAGNGNQHTKYSWGNNTTPIGKKGGNVADETAKATFSSWTIFDGYRDGYVYTAPVGSYEANIFGLHDMTGNVWEWCSDWYASDYYQNSPSNNPKGSSSGTCRVLRGGSLDLEPVHCLVANRSITAPMDQTTPNIGFRVVFS